MSDKLLVNAGKILKSQGGTTTKAFWAKAENNGTGLLKVTDCSEGISATILPKGPYQIHTLITRKCGIDHTTSTVLQTVLSYTTTSGVHKEVKYSDVVLASLPSGSYAEFEHPEIFKFDEDIKLDQISLDITEDGEHSADISGYIQVHSVASVGETPTPVDSDHKVSVDEGLEADYLSKVVEVESPITMSVNGNKLHFKWDGTSNNTLTLIGNMSLSNAIQVTNATGGTTSPGSKYGMTLAAFDIPNYFNLAQSDVFGIITTNLVKDVTLFKVAIYKLDFATNVLNLVAISKDYSEYLPKLHGYMEVEVDTIYRPSMDSYGIYYIGIMTDQPSVLVAAGADATLFNNYMPLMGINFHNISLDTTIESIDLNNGLINGSDTEKVSFQESVSRICCIYRHRLDDEGEPIRPDPDEPVDPPTPEDPTATYEREIDGSIYWQQFSLNGLTFTLLSDYGPVVEVDYTSSDDWSAATKTNVIKEYSDHANPGFKYKFGDSSSASEYDTVITKANGDRIELHLVESNHKYVDGSYIKILRVE